MELWCAQDRHRAMVNMRQCVWLVVLTSIVPVITGSKNMHTTWRARTVIPWTLCLSAESTRQRTERTRIRTLMPLTLTLTLPQP